MKIHGRLELAATELLSAVPTVGVVKGRFYYDTTDVALKVYDGTVWRKVTFRDTTETLTGKSISGATNTLTAIPLTTAVTGTLPIANGGTGGTTTNSAFTNLAPPGATGSLMYFHSANVWAGLNIGTRQQVLKVNNSGNLTWMGDERQLDVVNDGRFTVSGVTYWQTGLGTVTFTYQSTCSTGPLYPLVYPGVKITSSANTAESRLGHANYANITVPTAFNGKSMKLVFAYASPSASTWKVSVYDSNTRLALSTDSSGSTTLSANKSDIYSGTFTIPPTPAGSITVEITRTAGAGGAEDFYIQALSIAPNF